MDLWDIFQPKISWGAVYDILYSYVAYVLIMLVNGLNMENG